ncbi:MAG: hypothetical protein Q9174_004060 [Haloplaca sp. 1 TL-2023]
MAFPLALIFASLLADHASGCADHTGLQRGHISAHLTKRQVVSGTNPSYIAADWAYDASYNWGAIQPSYSMCQTGTRQSPIALSLTNGLSAYHQPTFSGYNKNVTGNWTNWGYGPAFNLYHPEDDYTSLPSMSWDNETAYLKGWHIHAPADHSVGGDRSKAEMHLVHVNATGKERAVLAIRLDPGISPMPFLEQLPPMVPFVTGLGRSPTRQDLPPANATSERERPQVVPDQEMNMQLVLDGVDNVSEFWTYKGSLTSPPCMEGIRWFVARAIAFTSVEEMRDILGACTYSAREEQEVWLHEINSA